MLEFIKILKVVKFYCSQNIEKNTFHFPIIQKISFLIMMGNFSELEQLAISQFCLKKERGPARELTMQKVFGWRNVRAD